MSASPAPSRSLRPQSPYPLRQRLAWLREDMELVGMSQRELARRAQVRRTRVRAAVSGRAVPDDELIALELVLMWAAHPRSRWQPPTLPTSITSNSTRELSPAERELDGLVLTILAAEKGASFRSIARRARVSPSTLSRARKGEIEVPDAAWPLVLPYADHDQWALGSCRDDHGVAPEHRLSPIEALFAPYNRGRQDEPLGSSCIATAEGRRPGHVSLDGVVLGAESEPSPFLREITWGSRLLLELPGDGRWHRLRCYRKYPSQTAGYRERCVIGPDYGDDYDYRSHAPPAFAVVEWGPRYPRASRVRLDIKASALRLGLGRDLSSFCLGKWPCDVVVREAHVAVDIDSRFRSAIVFEDKRHPRRSVQAYLANAVGSGRTNYFRLGSRDSALHYAVYDREDAARLPGRSWTPDCCELPLRIEAKMRLLRQELGLDRVDVIAELEAEMPRFFEHLRVVDLDAHDVQSLPRGALLSLSWIQRHGFIRCAPSLRRLDAANERRRAELVASREFGGFAELYDTQGLPVLMDAGEVVLDALLPQYSGAEAVALARRWYRATVSLLRSLPAQRLDSIVSAHQADIAQELIAITNLDRQRRSHRN